MADRATRLLAVAVALVVVGMLATVGRAASDGGASPAAAAREDGPLPTSTTTSASASASTTTSFESLPETSSSPSPPAAPTPTTATGIPVVGEVPPPDPAAIAPPALQAPAVGVYRERYDGPGGDGDGTLAVTRRGSSTTLRRRVEDSISSQTLRYDEQGIHLLVTSDGGGPCRSASSPLLQPAVLDVGLRWTSDATCTTADGVAVQRVEEAEVTGRARTTVDGVALDTWIIQRHIVETASGEGVVVVSETASSELFAPGVGLAVYRLARTDTPDAQGQVVSTAVAVELLSATPG